MISIFGPISPKSFTWWGASECHHNIPNSCYVYCCCAVTVICAESYSNIGPEDQLEHKKSSWWYRCLSILKQLKQIDWWRVHYLLLFQTILASCELCTAVKSGKKWTVTVNNGDAGYTELLAKIKVKTDSKNFASLRIVGYVRAFFARRSWGSAHR